jgi:hypothetical protein
LELAWFRWSFGQYSAYGLILVEQKIEEMLLEVGRLRLGLINIIKILLETQGEKEALNI